MRSILALLALMITGSVSAWAADAQVDRKLQPPSDEETERSPVFSDISVVQKKAQQKAGKFLLAPFFSLDFSDGPKTMYSINLNAGYAISDFWEVYVNFVPHFFVTSRSIEEKISSLTLQGGQKASIAFTEPKYQAGIEILYAFGYGKDSIGAERLVRSDTFLKLGGEMIFYDGDKGARIHVGVGKTYFLSKVTGFRVAIGANWAQTITDSVKQFQFMATLETGMTFYL